MRRSLLYSLIGIIALAVVALGVTLTSGNKPLLGLDLQGGASVVLQPQTKVSNGVLNQAIAIIRKRVDSLGAAEPNISRQGSNVVIELPGIKDPANALRVVGQTAQLFFRPVLCATSGSPTFFPPFSTTPPTTGSTTTTPGATTTAPGPTTTVPAPTTTKPAGGAFGPSGGRIPAAGLVAQTPATPPPVTAGPPPPVPTTVTGGSPTTSTTTPGTAATPTYDSSTCQFATTNVAVSLPTTPSSGDIPTANVLLPIADKNGNADLSGPRLMLGPATEPNGLNGNVVATATALPPDLNQGQSNWYVQVKFTSSGSPKFDKLAQANYQKSVAIALDGVVESYPTINAQSYSGTAIISGGNFTQSSAKNLALQLRYGSLPVQFQAQSIQTVSATIGKDSLHAGLLAGAVGLLLVLAYMLFYYRGLGLVVVLGLTLSGVLLYAIICQLSTNGHVSLSLAGATGIIVSVGVTTDSYIVYFERLKDEIRSGRSVRSSVDRGFSRAYRTIVAADLVSILAALVLYLFTVGSVRGFAFFLGLSTILDLITAYFFTRPMVALLGRSRLFTEARFFGVARGLAATPAGAPT